MPYRNPVRLKAMIGSVKNRRLNHEATVQQISDLCMPFRGDITTLRNEGQLRVVGVFDTTGVHGADSLANFLKSTVIPSSSRWFNLSMPTEFERNHEAVTLRDSAVDKMYREYATSNFYTQAGMWFRDVSVLGTGAFYTEEKPARLNADGSTFGGARFYSVPWGVSWHAIGPDGMYFYHREIELTAIDAFDFFNGEPGSRAMEALSKGDHMELIHFGHSAWKNVRGIPGGVRRPEEQPWLSQWSVAPSSRIKNIAGDGLELFGLRGHQLSPYTLSRWSIVDQEWWGRGQGHLARVDMLGINKLRELVLDAAGRDLMPPLVIESETAVDLDLGPDGLLVTKPPQKIQPYHLQSGARYDVANEIGTADRVNVERAFFMHLLQRPDTQPRSAAAVQDDQARVSRELAPRADIIYSDMIAPAVEGMMTMMSRAGGLPEIAQLARLGVPALDIEAVSPFFTAQKSQPMTGLAIFLQKWSQLAEATGSPQIMDNIDTDAAMLLDMELSDIPARVRRSPEAVEDIRFVRQEQIARQQALQQENLAADTLQKAAPEERGRVEVDQG